MHSRQSLESAYPGLGTKTPFFKKKNIPGDILPIYYGQADPADEIYDKINMTYLDSLDMLEVMTETIPSYYIQVGILLSLSITMLGLYVSKTRLHKWLAASANNVWILPSTYPGLTR